MHSQVPQGRQLSRRIPATAAAATAFFIFSSCCLSAPASAKSSQIKTPAVPTLKGGYVLTDMQVCTSGKGQSSQITALATFNTTSGMLKLDGYIATGDPLTLTRLKQTLSYSNSATTVTLGDTVYQVVYGTLEKGIAADPSLIAADDPCAAQIWLSHQ